MSHNQRFQPKGEFREHDRAKESERIAGQEALTVTSGVHLYLNCSDHIFYEILLRNHVE